MPVQTRKESIPKLNGKAFFRPETVDRENRTVEMVFTTGEAGIRQSWWCDPYEESLRVDKQSIRQARLEKGLSILDSHNRYTGIGAVLGITEEFRIEGGKLIGTARFSENQQAVFNDVADGILRHVSLGYQVHEYKITKPSKDGTIEKREAIDWEPVELSIVPVSFETTNGTRELERGNTTTNECIITYEDNEMPDPVKPDEQRSEQQPTGQQPAPAPQQRSDDTPAPSAQASQPEPVAPVSESEVRSDERKSLQPMLDASRAAGLPDQFAIDAFGRGEGIDAFRAAVIAKLGETRAPGAVKPAASAYLHSDQRQDQQESLVRGAEEMLMVRAGVTGAETTDLAREFTGMTMYEMARELLIASGTSVRGMTRQKIASRALHSTSDFPIILENVMHKRLLDGYNEVPRTFMPLGRKGTVNDFRAHNLYRVGDAPDLLPLGEHGEYKAGTLSEAKERWAIQTFARKIGFTRQLLINDDMSALDVTPRMFGQSGSRLESNLVWGMLLNYDFIQGKAASITMGDNKPLFHADHNNKLTGATSALSKDSLSNIRKLGRKAKTMDGNFMNVMYDFIAVSEDNETLVDELMSPSVIAALAADEPNRIKLKAIIEPRLAVVDPAAWYVFSSMMDTFIYGGLAGEEDMYTETVTSTDIDGIEVKVRKDFGCGLVDWRGMAMAAGK